MSLIPIINVRSLGRTVRMKSSDILKDAAVNKTYMCPVSAWQHLTSQARDEYEHPEVHKSSDFLCCVGSYHMALMT